MTSGDIHIPADSLRTLLGLPPATESPTLLRGGVT